MKKPKSLEHSPAGNTADRILNQSMRFFFQKGYHGTSIDDITKATGVTKGALYYHYRNKEEVLKRIIEEYEKRYLNGLIQAVKEVKGSVLDKFGKYFRYNAAFPYYNPDLCVSFTTLSGELVGAHHPIESEIRRINKKYQEFLSGLIRQGKKEKVFKKEIDPDYAALILIAFQSGILLHWSMNRDEIEGKAYVDIGRIIMLSGLTA
jgi:AcrR family transcriptional regulator